MRSVSARAWRPAAAAAALTFAASLAAPSHAHAATKVYPLKVASNHRTIVDQNNMPVLVVGDSPHSLLVNLTPAQAQFYFQNRAGYGVNLLWVEVLCAGYTGGRSDGSTYDGIVPFTTPNDFSTPNPAYFARLDQMLQLAAQSNITLLLDVIDNGSWQGALNASGPAKAFSYGAYLGNRYKDVPNILWIAGNDFQTWNTSPTDNANVAAIMQGIASADHNHMQTTELNYLVSGSLDDALLVPYINITGIYSYYPTYAEMLNQYNAPNAIPTLMLEANYEFEANNGFDSGNPVTLRRQEYWTILSGGAGQLYGSHWTWTFGAGWETHLDTPGMQQLGIMRHFFATRHWWNLIPDQTHAVVTAGYGTFATSGSIQNNNYVTAALTRDRSLMVAYAPTPTTLTVNMGRMKGVATAQWFDPSNGTYQAISGSPFTNAGYRLFTTPGLGSDGNTDWVLVLEAP